MNNALSLSYTEYPGRTSKIIRGTLADIGEKVSAAEIKKTAMVIVGHALAKGIPYSKLYSPEFSHEYRIGK